MVEQGRTQTKSWFGSMHGKIPTSRSKRGNLNIYLLQQALMTKKALEAVPMC